MATAAKHMHVVISKVSGPIFSGEALSVTLPGSEGEMTILPNHEPLISLLRQGTVTVVADDKQEKIPVEMGTLEVSNNQVTILL